MIKKLDFSISRRDFCDKTVKLGAIRKNYYNGVDGILMERKKDS